jgi:lysophospholipase L1-like esterase
MHARLTTILTVAIAIAAPLSAQRGSADLTRYVAVGDSLTAGYSNDSLVLSHQQWSFPSVIARQAGTFSFEQPLISEPGIPPELQLASLVPLVIGPKAAHTGFPLNLGLPRPYNNLGIPGARAGDLLTNAGTVQGTNPFFQIVLRGFAPAAHQALVLQPTFITVWAGNSDVLGAVTSGRTELLTPLDAFTASYTTLLDTLVAGAPQAGIVTATVPPLLNTPFVRTIPPVLIDPQTRVPIPGPDGNPVFLVAELGDGTVAQLGPGSLLTLNAQPFLSTGFGIPAALAPLIPLPDVGRPLPNEVVIDAAEAVAIEQRRQAINAAIVSVAGQRGIPVLVTDEWFGRLAEGVGYAGIELNLDFLTGGIIGFDGIHPTDIGYTLLANEFIRVINQEWDARLPYASILPLFSSNSSSLFVSRWMKLNLLEAPWSGFQVTTWEEVVQEERPEPSERKRRPVRSRGGG